MQTDSNGNVSRGGFLAGAAAAAATFGRCAMRADAHAAPAGTLPVPAATALARLVAGNDRFVSGHLSHSNIAVERRRAFAAYQAPFATLLTCSDSRVPPELIFDQNLGDLFIVRVAGNFADDVGLGTIEYGYNVLHSKLVVVLGHEGCGAIKATVDAIKTGIALPRHLNALTNGIAPGIAAIAKTASYDECVVANVRAQVGKLRHAQPVLAEAVASGDVEIVGAEYTFAGGKVMLLA